MDFDNIINRFLIKDAELSAKLLSVSDHKELVKLSKEYSEIKHVIAEIKKYNKIVKDIQDIQSLYNNDDISQEMKDMIDLELTALNSALAISIQNIKIAILPKEETDNKNAIIEIRAGVGGDEAALFASELFYMYQQYAYKQNWKFEVLHISDIGIGGYKEATAAIGGNGVFTKLQFESGVHRIQRVPETESCGRVHTSTATVAVLPEVDDIELDIKQQDLKIDTFRSSGAGGQSVNTTDSAVRITHIPTGIVVTLRDERSQHQNKAKGLRILRAKIYEEKRREKQLERAHARKSQVGFADRSAKIRTYNVPQSRISDHRINLTVHNFVEVMNGNLDEIISNLNNHYNILRFSDLD